MDEKKHPFVAVSPWGLKRQHYMQPGAQIVNKDGFPLLVGFTRCGRYVRGWEMGVPEDGNFCARCIQRSFSDE